MRILHSRSWRCGALAAACALAPLTDVAAGDHAEAPAVENDKAADIADIYAWHTDAGSLVMALTFGGYALAGDPPTYDPDVLYGFHIDTNADNTADLNVWARFGEDAAGNWGIQVVDVPGATGPIEGEVDTVIEAEGIKVFAGLRDDPFFFDKEGYLMTLSTGTVSFDSSRDFALLQNATAIVVEVPLANVASGPFSVWATTGRK
jgi:hypothetical protein